MSSIGTHIAIDVSVYGSVSLSVCPPFIETPLLGQF